MGRAAECIAAAGDDGPLVTVDNVCPSQVADQTRMERVGPLPSDPPCWTKDPNVEPSGIRPGRDIRERDQPGWSDLGHVPGEFEGVPLGPAVHHTLAKQDKVGIADSSGSASRDISQSGLQ